MPRIASLLPSATEMICALGFEKHLVGRSHECDFPPSVQKLPVLTQSHIPQSESSKAIDDSVRNRLDQALSLYGIRWALLKESQPEFIVTQDQCEVCAVSLDELESGLQSHLGKHVQIISLSGRDLAGIYQDFQRVAEALEVPQRGQDLIQGFKSRFEQIKTPKQRPGVLCIEWLDPLMVAGHWMPELIDQAGGRALIGCSGNPSPTVTWEKILEVRPESILLTPCGFTMERTLQEWALLTKKAHWEKIPAVQSKQVFLADGNRFFNRPGPRLLESFEILLEILRPQEFPPRHEGKAWQKLL